MLSLGLTYDLRADYLAQGWGEEETAEFDRPDTVEGIEEALANLGYRTERIGNIFSLVKALNGGRRWDMVFNICEGFAGMGREAQVPALLDAYSIPYTFSDPLVLALCLHKGLTKTIVRAAGVPTPDFRVLQDPEEAKSLGLPSPLFVKPVAEGTGKGITALSKVEESALLPERVEAMLQRFNQPVLIETFLPGREFTVGLVGTGKEARVLGIMEILLREGAEKDAYTFDNKENFQGRVNYEAVGGKEAELCAEVALKAWRALGCRDGGRLDLRMDERGIPNFLEVNPLAGLNPTISDLPILCGLHGISYQSLVEMIMESALKRVLR